MIRRQQEGSRWDPQPEDEKHRNESEGWMDGWVDEGKEKRW